MEMIQKLKILKLLRLLWIQKILQILQQLQLWTAVCSLHRCTNTVCSEIKNLCSQLQAKNRSVLQAGHSATFDNSDIQKPFQKTF